MEVFEGIDGSAHRPKSFGELWAMLRLKKYGMRFESEKEFPGLLGNIGLLRFDLCVYREDGSFFLIEIDGKQHRPGRVTPQQRMYDLRKDEFCKKRGIHLYRIKYCSGYRCGIFMEIDRILIEEGCLG